MAEETERTDERVEGVQEGHARSGATPRHHQEKVGIVTSAKMQKTIVVEVHRRVQHPTYKRYITKRAKFMAHDEHGKAHEGDMVRIVETRPLSKNKRWSLKEVLRAATTGV
ncbi:MAG TPA: 30S ribosomal protein S17 [Terriglobia bacterium]|nr:30S ribosomal protein S17 [Terriglobia bacterium]